MDTNVQPDARTGPGGGGPRDPARGGRAQHRWHCLAMPLMAFQMHYLVRGNRTWPLLSKGCVNKGGCAAGACCARADVGHAATCCRMTALHQQLSAHGQGPQGSSASMPDESWTGDPELAAAWVRLGCMCMYDDSCSQNPLPRLTSQSKEGQQKHQRVQIRCSPGSSPQTTTHICRGRPQP
jgi:hypothetical protein